MALNKERQSRMANSSLFQQPKKAGQGGYNWGGALDVKDYEPVGVVGASNVVVSPMSVASPVAVAQAQPVTFSVQDTAAFPTLGATAAAPAAVTRSWGPAAAPVAATVAAPSVLGEALASSGAGTARLQANLRPGALDIVGAQHPRNMFAKKANTRTVTEVAVAAQPQTIDWSQSGMPPSVMQQIIKASESPAHLGPYPGKPAEPIPIDALRSRTVAATTAQYMQPAAPAALAKGYAPKPANMIKHGYGQKR